MRKQSSVFDNSYKATVLRRFLTVLTFISIIGMAFWVWIQQNRSFLPPPDSKPGRALRYQYQGLTHDIWLILLLITIIFLINRIYTSRKREKPSNHQISSRPVQSCLRFIKGNPITTVLFIAYIVIMVSGTTYLYKDMFGWYPDMLEGNFLDNFSLRGSLIGETMRRTDYRFFPLAHQDLHILSWFSVHIKTWMLFSAAELIGIVMLSLKFLNKLEDQPRAKPATVLILTALLLIHPSTGTSFLHVIYCERLLCLVFILFINSYLCHLKTRSQSSFYETLLWALIGIFIKDIAILLFVIPPASIWIIDTLKYNNDALHKREISLTTAQNHQLERWLCSLSLLFIASYIILALIPSSYSLESAYNTDAKYKIILDFRFYLFALIVAIRFIAIASKKIQFQLLDGLNLTALGYASALAATYEFNANSYLALPFQLIATINITWAWIQLSENCIQQRFAERRTTYLAALATISIVGIDHITSKNTFTSRVIEQKHEQLYIQTTYEKLDEISNKIRELGEDVNIIISKRSRFSAYKSNLNRIPYRALIEYDPNTKRFIVAKGAHKGSLYSPKQGDLIANLDKEVELIEPILSDYQTSLIYRHNDSSHTGMIHRITALRQ